MGLDAMLISAIDYVCIIRANTWMLLSDQIIDYVLSGSCGDRASVVPAHPSQSGFDHSYVTRYFVFQQIRISCLLAFLSFRIESIASANL